MTAARWPLTAAQWAAHQEFFEARLIPANPNFFAVFSSSSTFAALRPSSMVSMRNSRLSARPSSAATMTGVIPSLSLSSRLAFLSWRNLSNGK